MPRFSRPWRRVGRRRAGCGGAPAQVGPNTGGRYMMYPIVYTVTFLFCYDTHFSNDGFFHALLPLTGMRVEELLVTCITYDVQRGVLFMGTQRGSVFLFRIGVAQGNLDVTPFRYVRPSPEAAGNGGASNQRVVDVTTPASCITSIRSDSSDSLFSGCVLCTGPCRPLPTRCAAVLFSPSLILSYSSLLLLPSTPLSPLLSTLHSTHQLRHPVRHPRHW